MNPILTRSHMSAWGLALIGAFACQAPALATPAEAASARHQNALPSVFRNGEVLIKVTINGHPGAWMMLDTGTTDSMIDTEYAASIGLKLQAKAQGAGGFGGEAVPSFSTDTVRVQAGTEPEKVVFFDSIRLAGMLGPDGAQLAGLLGHSFLDQRVLVIDYKNQLAYFDDKPQHPDPRDIPMTLVEGIPRIQVKMEHQWVASLIDSGGAYSTIITPATVAKLGIEKLMNESTSVDMAGHGAGSQAIALGKAPPFSVGTISVRDVRAAYTTFGSATEALKDVDMSLGIGFLKDYKLTLNYPGSTVRFEP